jgi:hypothetical protein
MPELEQLRNKFGFLGPDLIEELLEQLADAIKLS